MSKERTIDAMSGLTVLIEKYREGPMELHFVFVSPEKTYDRAPREELWYCVRKFADILIFSESRERVKNTLERWRYKSQQQGRIHFVLMRGRLVES